MSRSEMTSASYAFCSDQVRRFDKDRFLCALFAPPSQRRALIALYAFNLEIARIREVVREPMLGRIRLQWWHDVIDDLFAGRVPAHSVAEALGETIAQFGLSRGHFDRLLQGRAFDLEDSAPEDLPALIDYADATSTSLGLLSLEILGTDTPPARSAVREVAISWALIGLVRAIPFHARTRRIYLPAGLNREAGLDVFELFERGPTSGLEEVVGTLLKTASEYLASARKWMPSIPREALPALLTATLADCYLDRLNKAGFNPFDARIQSQATPRELIRLVLSGVRARY